MEGGGTLLSVGFIFASLTLYQSYFQAAILLFMLVCIKRLFDGEKAIAVVLDGLRAILILILALVVYEISMRVIEWKLDISRASGGNGIGSIDGLINMNILKLLVDTYRYPFMFMSGTTVHQPEMTAFLYGAVLIITLVLMIVLAFSRHLKKANVGLIAALVFLLPLGINAVYFIASGNVKARMLESYYLFFALTIYVVEQIYVKKWNGLWVKRIGAGALVALTITCFNHIVYGNQMYIRRDLEFQSTLSVMTRVIDRAEQVEGYNPGYTPVAFIGTMYNSPLSMQRSGFEHLTQNSTSNGNNYYVTASEEFYQYYFWEILGYPFNLLGEFERSKLALEPDIRKMPVFPAEGSLKMRDGILIIKVGALKNLDR